MARDFRKLEIWSESHNLVLDLYKSTKKFPSDEKYGLISQIRRSSASIATNICEACGQDTSASTKRFLRIAHASAKELEYQILLAHDLKYITKDLYEEYTKRIIKTSRMIYRFISNMPIYQNPKPQTHPTNSN